MLLLHLMGSRVGDKRAKFPPPAARWRRVTRAQFHRIACFCCTLWDPESETNGQNFLRLRRAGEGSHARSFTESHAFAAPYGIQSRRQTGKIFLRLRRAGEGHTRAVSQNRMLLLHLMGSRVGAKRAKFSSACALRRAGEGHTRVVSQNRMLLL